MTSILQIDLHFWSHIQFWSINTLFIYSRFIHCKIKKKWVDFFHLLKEFCLCEGWIDIKKNLATTKSMKFFKSILNSDVAPQEKFLFRDVKLLGTRKKTFWPNFRILFFYIYNLPFFLTKNFVFCFFKACTKTFQESSLKHIENMYVSVLQFLSGRVPNHT